MGRVQDRKARHSVRSKRGLLFEPLEPRRLLDAAGHGLFEREVFPVSSCDVSPVAADLNRDGAMDYVAVGGSTGDYYAAALIGRGDGTFEPQTTWAVGRLPSDLAVGDVNGDSIPDLVVSNKGLQSEGIENTVSVLIGNGDGTFQTQVKYTTGGRPDQVAIADMNKDGLADLVTLNREGPVGMPRNVSILFGLGGGTFGSRQDYAFSVYPEQLAVTDLNNDGWPDVVACGYQSSQSVVVVRLGGAGGTLGAESTYSASYSAQELAVRDLNGDSKPDVVVGSWNPGSGSAFTGLSVFLGVGDGTFNPRTDIATDWQPSALTLADVNGDGRQDALTASNLDQVISVFLGTAGGGFGPATDYMPGPECTQIAVADFNADGKADIALSDQCAVMIIPGNGDGTFQSAPAYGRGTVLATGDVNGDHIADLVTTIPDNRGMRVRFGLGNGRFGAATTYTTGGELESAAIADFNHDGAADIVAASSGQTYLLVNQGNGTFVAQTPYTGGAYNAIQVGDLNADTRPDVMLIGDDVLVRFGQANGTLGAPVNVLPEIYCEGLGTTAVADFTGDGIKDIAAVGALGYRVFPGRSDGTFGQPVRTAFLGDWVVNGWSRAAAGDVNGDNKQDLVVEVETGSQHETDLFVVLGNGNGTFAVPQRYEDQVESFALGDVNGDGRTDVITGKGPVFLGQADGTLVKSLSSWQPSFIDLGPQNLADLNGDGRPDFVGNVDLAVVSLLGDGRGGFGWPAGHGPRYPVGPDPKDVALADLNGDGHLDAVTANQGYSAEAHKNAGFFTVTVRLGEGNGRFGPAVDYFVNGSPRAVTTADLDGDGAPEIVTANEDFHTVAVLRNLGNGTFAPYQEYDVMGEPVDVAIADINGDGRPDLLAVTDRDLGCDLLSVRLGIGGGFFGEETVYRIGSGPTSLDVGDFNRDGKLDVVTAAEQDSAVTVLFGDGQGSFAAPTSLGVGGQPNSVAVADLNGDGAPDIVAGAPASVLINAGNGTFLPYVAYGVRQSDNAIRLADINGDAIQDIVAATTIGPSILLGKGNGTFRPQVTFAAPSPVVYHELEALAIGDVNEDGRPDVVAVPAMYEDSFRVFLQSPGVLGSGAGATGLSGTPATIPSPIPLTVTDDQHPLQNQTRIDVSGTISANANWSGLVVVEGSTAIAAGVTVNVAPGTIVKFKPHQTQWGTFELGKLNVYGTLNAQGTAALPIVFTSFADDTAGGDTNQDGSLTRPATDDWDGINFVDGTVNSVISHVEIRYADVGIGGYLHSPSTAPVISDTLITSADSGLSLHAPYANISRLTVLNTRKVAVSFETDGQSSTPSVLSDITVNGAGWGGIAITSLGEVHLQNAHISGVVNGYPLNVNGVSNLAYLTGLQIDGASCGLGETVYANGGNFARNVTLTPDFLWVINGLVEGGTTLTMLPGTVVKTDTLIVKGTLNARGTAEHPITITALYDDTIGGDIGQDGWGDDPRSFGHVMSVKLVGAGASGSVLENVVIRCGGRYVGGSAEAALRIDNASPTISNVTIQNSYFAAMEVLNGAAPSIRNVTIDHVMAAEGTHGGYGFYAQANAGEFTVQGAAFNRVENWPVYVANPSHWVRLSGLDINATTCDRGAAGFVNAGTMTTDGSPQGDMVWQIGAITIAGGTHVTMGPGTILKGEILTVNGTLDAVGNAAKPVIFTSVRDDTAGGDTNLDGGAVVPASGSGLRLRVNASGHATVERGQFRYGPDAAVQIEQGQAHLVRTEIRNAAGRAVVVNGGQAEVNGCTILQPSTAGVYVTGQSQVEVANTLIGLAGGSTDGVQGLGSDPAKLASIGLVNNTIVGGVHGVSLDGRYNLVRAINNVIAFNGTVGIGLYHGATASSEVRCNDVYNPGAAQGNYANMHNYTGENGNISVDPKLQDRAGGDYRLAAMSPCIDAAYGNAAPSADRIGAPRFDDWGVPNTGQGQPNYADMGSDERIEDSTSPVDLIVVEGSIVGPTAASFGQTVTVQWTVRNAGTAPAVGPWHDQIYLATSSDTTDPGTLAGEVLVGQGVTLQPGQTLACTANVKVPAVTLGDHYWQIQTNCRLEVPEGVNRTNNLRTDTDPVSVTLPELTLGHTVQETFELAGDAHYWFIRLAANQEVLLTLDDLNNQGSNEIYVGLNGIPTRSDYQFRFQDRTGADQRMQFSSPFPTVAYIMVYGRTVPDAPGQFNLTAEAPGFKVERMTPNSGGDRGNVTALIEGQGFGADDWVCLVRQDGERIWASNVWPVDGSRMYAMFNLADQPLGFYDVLVEKPDGSETLKEDFFQVRDGTGPVLEANLIVPDNIRRGDFFPITITWANTGDVDMVAPIINLTGPDGITYTRWGENDQVSDVQFVASSSTGPAGVLQPGDREEITFYGLASLWTGGYAYTLQTIIFNWQDPYEVEMDPGVLRGCFSSDILDMTGAEMEPVWEVFEASLGETQDEVIENLANRVTAMNAGPDEWPLVRDLLLDLLCDAESGGGGLLDATLPYVVTRRAVIGADNSLQGIDLIFSEDMDPATIGADDVILTNPLGQVITPVTVVARSGQVFRISFASQSAPGVYTLAFGPNAADTAGLALDQNQSGVGGQAESDVYHTVVEVSAPQAPLQARAAGTEGEVRTSWARDLYVVGISETGKWERQPGLPMFVITFSKPVNVDTFSAQDIAIGRRNTKYDPVQVLTSVHVGDLTPLNADCTQFQVNLREPDGPLNCVDIPGFYTVRIGTDIMAKDGTLFDQDHNAVNGQTYYEPLDIFEIIDSHGPTVTSFELPEGWGRVTRPPVSQVDILFSEPIHDFPAGAVTVEYDNNGTWEVLPIIGAPQLINDSGGPYPKREQRNHWRVTFTPKDEEGTYRVTVGPGVTDYYGRCPVPMGLWDRTRNEMDQDQDGKNGETNGDDTWDALFEAVRPSGEVYGRIQYIGDLATLFGSDMHVSVQLWEMDGDTIDLGTNAFPGDTDDFISDWNLRTNGPSMQAEDVVRELYRRGIVTQDGCFRFEKAFDGEPIDFVDLDDGNDEGLPPGEQHIPEFYIVVVAKNQCGFVLENGTLQDTQPNTAICMPLYPDRVPEGKDQQWGRLVFQVSPIMRPSSPDIDELDFGTIQIDENQTAFGLAQWLYEGGLWLHDALGQTGDQRPRGREAVIYSTPTVNHVDFVEGADFIQADEGATDPFEIMRAYGHAIDFWAKGHSPDDIDNVYGILIESPVSQTAWYEAWATYFAARVLENRVDAWPFMSFESRNRSSQGQWEYNNFWMAWDAYGGRLQRDASLDLGTLQGQFVYNGAMNYVANHGDVVMGACMSIYWDLGDVVVVGETGDDYVNEGMAAIIAGLAEDWYPGIPLTNAMKAIYIDQGIITTENGQSVGDDDMECPLEASLFEDRGGHQMGLLVGPFTWKNKVMAEDEPGYGDRNAWFIWGNQLASPGEKDNITVRLGFDPHYGDLDLEVAARDLGVEPTLRWTDTSWGNGRVQFNITLERDTFYGLFVDVAGHGALNLPDGQAVTYVGDMHPSYSLSINPTPDPIPLKNVTIHSEIVVPVITSWDPNEKSGPAGVGANHYVTPGNDMPYTIYFENDPELATAPARTVGIVDQLDADLDWSTFEWGVIQFGERTITVPDPAMLHFETDTTVSYDAYPVHVVADFNPQTGRVTWELQSRDPHTGEPPRNPMAGFLPPNDDTGHGEGFVTYSIRSRSNLTTGTQIRNVAEITFDTGPTFTTNQIDPRDPSQGTDPAKECLNTIDAGKPSSQVAGLPATTATTSFLVTWSGQDDAGGSGITSYDIYVSTDNGPFVLWKDNTAVSQATFTGQNGHTYAFYSTAQDAVGHVEQAPGTPDAQTQVRMQAKVVSWQVGGGLTQRSDVRTLQVGFSDDVQVDAGDMTLTNLGVNADVDADAIVAIDPGMLHFDASTHVLTLSFGQSLGDGWYEFRLNPAGITSPGGLLLSSDGTGPYRFHRLLGDLSADQVVNVQDVARLRQSMGSPYNANSDVNGDGQIDGHDVEAIMGHMGATVVAPLRMRGDLTGDGAVNVLDVARLRCANAGIPGSQGDVNGDGQVNAADADQLMRTLGVCVTPPAGASSKPVLIAGSQMMGVSGRPALGNSDSVVENTKSKLRSIERVAQARSEQEWMGFEDIIRRMNEPHVTAWSVGDPSELILGSAGEANGGAQARLSDSAVTESTYSDGGRGGEDLMSSASPSDGEPMPLKAWHDALLPDRYEDVLASLEG